MDTQFVTAFETGADGRTIGKRAARTAREALETDRMDFWIAVISHHVDFEATLDGIQSEVDESASSLAMTTVIVIADDGLAYLDMDRALDPSGDGALALGVCASDTFSVNTAVADGLNDGLIGVVRSVKNDLPTPSRSYQALLQASDPNFGRPEELSLRLQQRFGSNFQVAGGGAQPDAAFDAGHPYVAADGQIAENGLAVAMIDSDRPLSLGADHGHDPHSGPYTVTDSDGQTIYELDDQPAFETWKRAVQPELRELFDVDIGAFEQDDERLEMLQYACIFGVESTTGGYNGRALQVVKPERDGSIDVYNHTPEGTEVWILIGHPGDQAHVARSVAQQIDGQSPEVAGSILFECSGRWLWTGMEFEDVTAALSEEIDGPFIGSGAGGQVCMYPGDIAGYNSFTTVGISLPK